MRIYSLDFLLETVSYSNVTVPYSPPSAHKYLFSWTLISSSPIGPSYQLVATVSMLLVLVFEPSIMVPPHITHNFVISLFVNKL